MMEAVNLDMNSRFKQYREEYPVFFYDGFKLAAKEGFIQIRFDFTIDGLCEFHPEIKIATGNLRLLNAFASAEARDIVFALGMTEAVSYWKCVCPPRVVVRCGVLSEQDKLWWKKLWYNGLSEFFFLNRIQTDFESFVNIENDFGCEKLAAQDVKTGVETGFHSSGLNIIPVGGGKDSIVTLELLHELCDKNLCFTVNDQPARSESVIAAGYSEKDIIKVYRTIDRELLKRNEEKFLNGHTPFSAIVAFLSYYCAYITGADNIILSNESSANEANVVDTVINHQYSKSYEFESDFRDYVKRNFSSNINYFSLLRAFNELQIAKQFAVFKKYHSIFKSCNKGSKENIWCGTCAKCLFVYIILSPFLEREELIKIFGCDMLEKESLRNEFEGLIGVSKEKPFECIGTVEEVCCALEMTAKRYIASGIELPFLLKNYMVNQKNDCGRSQAELLSEFNEENNIPEKFKKYVAEMYDYVSGTD